MVHIAEWVAPAATMIAAIITAANLGALVTGWGFVIFVVGSLAWLSIGISTGQSNLVATNALLTVVNLFGVWRWLGRQSRYDQGARYAAVASRHAAAPTLFTATGISGRPVFDLDENRVGTAIEALVTCQDCSMAYVVVSTGGIAGVAEELRAVDRSDLKFETERLVILDTAGFRTLPLLTGEIWPERTDAAKSLLN